MAVQDNQAKEGISLELGLVIYGVAILIISLVLTLLFRAHHPNFFYVFGWVAGVITVITVPTIVVSSVVESMRPRIYLIKDRSLFLYCKGNKRVVFDYLSLFKDDHNGGSLGGGVNELYFGKYKAVNEGNSYLAFDKDNEIIALLPYSKRTSNDKRDVMFIDAQDNEHWMSIDGFISDQVKFMRERHMGHEPEIELANTPAKKTQRAKIHQSKDDWIVS